MSFKLSYMLQKCNSNLLLQSRKEQRRIHKAQWESLGKKHPLTWSGNKALRSLVSHQLTHFSPATISLIQTSAILLGQTSLSLTKTSLPACFRLSSYYSSVFHRSSLISIETWNSTISLNFRHPAPSCTGKINPWLKYLEDKFFSVFMWNGPRWRMCCFFAFILCLSQTLYMIRPTKLGSF